MPSADPTGIPLPESEVSDQELVARSQQGDMTAFDELVTRYRTKVYAMAFNMVRNESDAWDLSQDVFIKAWKALPKFENRSRFFTWLFRITHNVCYDWLRSRRIQSAGEFDDSIGPVGIEPGALTVPHGGQRPDHAMTRGEVQQRIRDAIEELSPDHRSVILLKEIEGFSYQEIADTIGCSLGTVMSRLFYARKRLQTLLADVHAAMDCIFVE